MGLRYSYTRLSQVSVLLFAGATQFIQNMLCNRACTGAVLFVALLISTPLPLSGQYIVGQGLVRETSGECSLSSRHRSMPSMSLTAHTPCQLLCCVLQTEL